MKNILIIIVSGFGVILLIALYAMFGAMSFTSSGYDYVEEEAFPSWSPSGDRLAIECYVDGPAEDIAENYLRHYTQEAADICTVGIDGHNRVRLTTDLGADRYPVWSPDGSQLAYIRQDGIYLIYADGSNQRRLVHHSNALEEIDEVSWSPNGNKLLFSSHLKSSDHNIYLVDVNTGELTNLTVNSNKQNFSPVWTLDGAKIVFLTSDHRNPVLGQVPSQLKVINVDGSNEQVIYDKEIFFNFVSAANTGQILFTTYDLSQDNFDHLYIASLGDKGPVEVGVIDQGSRPSWDRNRWSNPILSPDGKYLVFEDRGLLVLEVATGKIRELPYIGPIEGKTGWSPDSQQIAVTVLEDTTGFYEERHVYIINVQNGAARPLLQR